MRLSPEEQFISSVLSLGLKTQDPHGEERRWPRDGINWDGFVPLVAHHGLGPLLFHRTRNLNLEKTLPYDVSKGLEDLHRSSTGIWGTHRQILRRILRRFCETGLEVVLLKGAQLAHSDYPEPCLRPIEDIDLLVRRSNRAKVMRLMLEMGFNPYETNQTCDKFFIRRIPKHPKKALPKPIFVEVHSNLQTPIRLNRSFDIDIDELWKGARERVMFGFPFLELCPTHNLIYLCAHLGHHHFSRLIWAYDIALLVHRHRTAIEWKTLEYICGSVRIKNSLYYGLSLCQEFFGVPIPDSVLRGLSPSWGRGRMGQFLIRRHLRGLEKSRVSRFNQCLIKAILIDSWREAIRWFLFPTREWMKQEYSPGNTHRIYRYYLLHPLLYLIKTMRTPVR